MYMRIFAACCALILTLTSAWAQDRRLTIAADEWPPFSGNDLPGGGIALDITSAVLERAGYAVETVVVPWARIMDGARSGEFDIITSLFADAELAEFLTYSAPFYATDVQLVQPAGASHSYDNVRDLVPFSIAVGDGFLYQDEFDRADYLKKVVVTTTQQAIQMVAHGRVDLTLDSVDVVRYVIDVQDPALADRVELAPGVLASQSIHMAVRSDLDDSATIVADFNATLAQMQADGSLEALLSRHVAD